MNITPFQFDSHQVRVVDRDGSPWFLAADVCHTLGIENAGNVYCRLDASEKSFIHRADVGAKPGRPFTLVNESGLYKLIMRSDKPQAKRFQNWVTQDVLPTIRKTGSYGPQNIQAALADPAWLRTTLLSYTEKVLELESRVAEQEPKVVVYDQIANSEGLFTMREASTIIGWSPNRLTKVMLSDGSGYKLNGRFQPKASLIQKGFFRVVAHTVGNSTRTQAYATPTGLQAICKRYGRAPNTSAITYTPRRIA